MRVSRKADVCRNKEDMPESDLKSLIAPRTLMRQRPSSGKSRTNPPGVNQLVLTSRYHTQYRNELLLPETPSERKQLNRPATISIGISLLNAAFTVTNLKNESV